MEESTAATMIESRAIAGADSLCSSVWPIVGPLTPNPGGTRGSLNPLLPFAFMHPNFKSRSPKLGGWGGLFE